MRSPQVDVPSGGIGPYAPHWGLGWGLHEWSGRQVLAHDGGTIGQYAFLRVVPEAGVAVALLTNGGDAIGLFRALGGAVLHEVAGVEMPGEVTPPDEPLAFEPTPYLGRYEREGASFEVVARDRGMVAIQTVIGLGSS